jgi:hypothetical protein
MSELYRRVSARYRHDEKQEPPCTLGTVEVRVARYGDLTRSLISGTQYRQDAADDRPGTKVSDQAERDRARLDRRLS